jgi:hypothetical protein
LPGFSIRLRDKSFPGQTGSQTGDKAKRIKISITIKTFKIFIGLNLEILIGIQGSLTLTEI